jgi:hypothetical protein
MRWPGEFPPTGELTDVSLPLSRVSQRRLFRFGFRVQNLGKPDSKPVRPISVGYMLHGAERQERPLELSMFTQDANAPMPIAERVDPRALAERKCSPTRLDPAAAGEIRQIDG